MAHTLIRNVTMLEIMFQYCDAAESKVHYEDLRSWNLSWPLLQMVHEGQVTVSGITPDGWSNMEDFYEWLIGHGMEPVF
jgi:hypothetical protein